MGNLNIYIYEFKVGKDPISSIKITYQHHSQHPKYVIVSKKKKKKKRLV